MIPILYDTNETLFTSNGLGRLRDCISAEVVEERNSIYELDFQYPVTGANYDLIQVGRIVGVTHDESGDIEPFDIVSYTKPIDGVVTFHCVHISYRLSYMTVTASNINSLADAFTAFASAEPSMPFSFMTDKTSTGYVAGFDGLPHTVRSLMGGTEGSLLDAYGGEYAFNNWTVYLHSARGQFRDFAIRYGVNMLDYNEDYDSQGTYSSCVPYWTDGENTVVGDRQDSPSATITGRGECVPLDVSEKFEDQPTKAQVEAMGLSMLTGKNTSLPTQNIHVEFVRLQDLGYENLGNLMQCKLCDTIKVIFPDYGTTGQFKIVKTVWDVLMDRYDEMELGTLSTTLSEALGISNGLESGNGSSNPDDYVVEVGTSGIWTYRKWNSGIAECWGTKSWSVTGWTTWGSLYYSTYSGTVNYPTGLFLSTPVLTTQQNISNNDSWLASRGGTDGNTKDHTNSFFLLRPTNGSTGVTAYVFLHAVGNWK